MGAGRPKGIPKTGGRKPGTLNKATADVKALAQIHGPEAITVLVAIMTAQESPQARIAAAKELLDRGYGKAPQAIEGANGMPLIPALVQFIREPDTA